MKLQPIITTLALAAALTACTADEPQAFSDKAIEFTTEVEGFSRGVTTDVASLNSVNGGFRVTANIGKNKTKNYFTSLLFNSGDNGVTWRQPMGVNYPWPIDQRVYFYATSPIAINANLVGGDTLKIENFTPNEDVSTHVDLMAAYSEGIFLTTSPNQTVNLKFQHLLSNIYLELYRTNERIGMRILAAGIFNLKSGATFVMPSTWNNGNSNLSNMSTNSDAGAQRIADMWHWDDVRTDKKFISSLKNRNNAVLVGQAPHQLDWTRFPQDETQSFLVQPQEITGWDRNNPNDTEGVWIGLLCNVAIAGDRGGVQCVFPSATDNPGNCGATTFQEMHYSPDKESINYGWVAIPFPSTTLKAGRCYKARVMLGYANGGVGFMAPSQPRLAIPGWDNFFIQDTRSPGSPITAAAIRVVVDEINYSNSFVQ